MRAPRVVPRRRQHKRHAAVPVGHRPPEATGGQPDRRRHTERLRRKLTQGLGRRGQKPRHRHRPRARRHVAPPSFATAGGGRRSTPRLAERHQRPLSREPHRETGQTLRHPTGEAWAWPVRPQQQPATPPAPPYDADRGASWKSTGPINPNRAAVQRSESVRARGLDPTCENRRSRRWGQSSIRRRLGPIADLPVRAMSWVERSRARRSVERSAATSAPAAEGIPQGAERHRHTGTDIPTTVVVSALVGRLDTTGVVITTPATRTDRDATDPRTTRVTVSTLASASGLAPRSGVTDMEDIRPTGITDTVTRTTRCTTPHTATDKATSIRIWAHSVSR